MTFDQLVQHFREIGETVPGFTVVPRTTERRDTIKCAECDRVIRQGGTGVKLELCGRCTEPGTDAR